MAKLLSFETGPISNSEAKFRDYLLNNLGDGCTVLTQYGMKNRLRKRRQDDNRSKMFADFIVIHPVAGAWVLEAKHWRPDTVLAFMKAKVLIRPQGKSQELTTNPYLQADEYLRCLKAESKDTQSSIYRYFGELSVPFGAGVAFTNMTRNLFCGRGHDTHAQLEKTLFHEDINYNTGFGFGYQLIKWLEHPERHLDKAHYLLPAVRP